MEKNGKKANIKRRIDGAGGGSEQGDGPSDRALRGEKEGWLC